MSVWELKPNVKKEGTKMGKLAVFVVVLVAVAHCDGGEYRITDLGTLGGLRGGAHGINERGQVAGYADIAADVPGVSHAFLRLPEAAYGLPAGMNDLGTLGDAVATSIAWGINDTGQVAGWTVTAGLEHHAFLWLPEAAYGLPAGMSDLGTLGGDLSTAWGINDAGQVMGYAETVSGWAHAFLWLPEAAYGLPAGMNDLGTLGGTVSGARGINDAGQVVGDARTERGWEHAFLWLPEAAYGLPAGMNDLGTLDLWPTSYALGINDAGQVVGYVGTTGAETHWFLWLPEAAYGLPAGMNDLGTPLGGAWTYPCGINEAGQVAGSAETAGGVLHAFLWLPETAYGLPAGFNNLGTLGGTKSWAGDINEVGQVVGCADTAGDEWHACLWTPPPALAVVAITEADRMLRLTWSSRPDATYTVWSCVDLAAGPWEQEATPASGGETTTWTDSDTTSTRKFYRIEVR